MFALADELCLQVTEGGHRGGRHLKRKFVLAATLGALASSPAWAGDKVLFGPAPGWIAAAPAQPPAGSGPYLPRFDEQVRVDGDTVTAYVDYSKQVTSPEQLTQLGTLSLGWQPAHGDITFHRIEILRAGQVIDVLKGGEGFSVLRREAGLERLEVDGQLTAVKHIEGLQVGDVLRAAFSIAQRDPTLAGNVQDGLVLLPAPLKLGYGRARLVWPTTRAIGWRAMMPGLTLAPKALDGQWTELVVSLPVTKLPEMPKNMPSRFTPVPMLQFSSFADWASVAKVMAPLYAVKGTIAQGSDLAGRVDAIAARSADPVRRMADALQLVQDEVRYQLIALGNGNYVPQTPADTWAKRYGDCKAKTRLLLAILDRLGIDAEPVMANSQHGDGVAQMLPSVMAFDHVFVHARAGGEDYWLDGTMLGSRLADVHDVPLYGYVLPVLAPDAKLVDLPRRAHARPDVDVDLAYDMSSGPHLPAPFHLTLRYQGTYAASRKVEQNADYDEKLTSAAEKAAKLWTGSETIGKPHAEYDAVQAVWTMQVDGVAYPDWKYRDGHYALAVAPDLTVTYDAPRDRASWRAIPALIDAPWTAHSRVVTHLPDGGQAITLTGAEPGNLDIPAVAWHRKVALSGAELVDDITSAESGAEIAADKVSATAKLIEDAKAKTAHLSLAAAYPQRWDDVGRMNHSPALAKARAIFDQRIADKPDDAVRLTDRAWLEERLFDWAGAQADYTKAIALDASAARYVSRAQLRSKRGDHPGALADAQAAYDLEQGNHDAREQLAVELAEAGKVDQGLDLLPANPDITTDDGLSDFLGRLQVMELGDRHADALALLDEALDKRGSSANLRNARCWYQALRNSALDVALADCNKAIELSSDPAGYLDSRALVHFREGHFEQARVDYEAALAAQPEIASSLFMAGIAYARLGDKHKSALDLSAARKLDPDIDRFYLRFGIKP